MSLRCGKKRKLVVDHEAEKTLYSSFVSAANAVSQLYSQAVSQQRKASAQASRQALVRYYVWCLFASHTVWWGVLLRVGAPWVCAQQVKARNAVSLFIRQQLFAAGTGCGMAGGAEPGLGFRLQNSYAALLAAGV